MATQPAIRVAATHDFLEVADEIRAGLKADVLAVLPETTRKLVLASVRIGWMPIEDHMIVLEAVRQVAGVGKLRPMWNAAMLRSFKAPTLRVLVEGAKRMFGMTPRGLAKAAPRGYGLLTRDLGSLDVRGTEEEGRAELHLVGFPVEHMRSGTFVEGLAGCIESFFSVCGVAGNVTVVENDVSASRAVYRLDWR